MPSRCWASDPTPPDQSTASRSATGGPPEWTLAAMTTRVAARMSHSPGLGTVDVAATPHAGPQTRADSRIVL